MTETMSLNKHSVLSEFIDNPEVTMGFSKDIKRLSQYKDTIHTAYVEFTSAIGALYPSASSLEANTFVVGPVDTRDIDIVRNSLYNIVSDNCDGDINEIINYYFNIKTVDDAITIEKIR